MFKKNFKNIIIVILFMIIIALPMIVWNVLSLDQTLDFDIGEKRNKATLSETLNMGNFSSEYEKYYNDRIPFRSILITMKQNIDAFIERPYKTIEKAFLNMISLKSKGKVHVKEIDGVIRLYMDDAVDIFRNHKLKKTDFDPYVEGVEYPVKYLCAQVINGQSDWLYLNIDNMRYYKGENTPTLEELENNHTLYMAMGILCAQHNKQIVFLICPEKEEIYPEYMPTMDIVDEKERSIYVKDYLATMSDVIYIYPKEELLKQKENYRLYKKYDSHWNSMGGYIEYNEFKKAIGMDIIEPRDLVLNRISETSKDLLFLSGVSSAEYNDSFEYVVDYKSDVKAEITYTDSKVERHVTQFKSDAADKRHVLLIGDSFRNDMDTYFSKDFEKYTSVAFNYMNGNKVVNDAIRDADIIVIQAVERNETSTVQLICQKIIDILLK